MLDRPRRLERLPVLALAALAAGISVVLAQTAPPGPQQPRTAVATFAGGCFWCVEEAFDKVPGVLATVSGYTGGTVPNPTYEQVSRFKNTGHAEAVRVTYDPAKVSYRQLVDWFWRNIDPTQAGGQFCDRGSPYRSGIFFHDEEQRRIAEETKAALAASGRLKEPIVTEITAAGAFYEAEPVHQDYYRKNPDRYAFYKLGCGRVRRLEQLWGKATRPPGVAQ
jgi:methionine-S-sulfoxide reductase